jgi:hypothetical protein
MASEDIPAEASFLGSLFFTLRVTLVLTAVSPSLSSSSLIRSITSTWRFDFSGSDDELDDEGGVDEDGVDDEADDDDDEDEDDVPRN